ncbi:MAG: LLM class F420-dependent oxidoreductase, partial [Acidimicrobiia bacterium]
MRFRIFVEPQEGATYDDQRVLAQLAEELGFD